MITLDQIDLKNITPQDLGELLITAKKIYFTSDKPIMDDHTYDILEDILRQKAPYHRIFSKVGSDNFDTGFDKKKHSIPMGSQNKVNKYEDLVHYFELKNSSLNKNNFAPLHQGGIEGGFVVQPKCDGISLEIVYQNSQLVEAITRGDGFIGDIITQNVVKMKNFVQNPSNFTGSIRCEIVVTKDDFKKLNNSVKNSVLPALSREGGPANAGPEGFYSNPRNAASGLSQRLDGKYCEFCTLMAVDILSESMVKTEQEKISLLKSLGFTPVESTLCHNFSEIEAIYQKFLRENRLSYPYDIDGLVIKINDLNIARELGSKNNRPKFQVAYKFPADSNQSQIKKIDWQVGPMGSITPVAEIEPIELSGAVITFASLGNYNLVIKKDLNIGDIIEISRRGDVIPHIEKVVTKVKSGHTEIPEFCPSCGTKLIKEDKFLRCLNSQNCLGQVLGSLRVFCDTLGILGLSDKTIAKLYQAGKIRLPGDFYKLTVADISGLDNLGEKSAKNILHQIQEKKSLTLKQIFDAAVIPNFSAARVQQLINAGFNTPEKLLNISQTEIESLPGFQKTLADKVWQGIQLRKPWLESILSNISLQSNNITQKLSGLIFCITGDLSMPRPKFIELIESHGGKFNSAVSQNTNYLISNEIDSKSSKFTTAKKLNIPIISETDFIKLLNY
ncbi:MAG: NAD-dependent DNA ligase LigA [Candidatus Shapirobacteria bacterium]|jgi:DNA ligase (NAD+)